MTEQLDRKKLKEEIVQIGSIATVLVNLTPFSQQVLLDGFKMAFLNRHIEANGTRWEFVEIFYKAEEPFRVMARVQERREDEPEKEQT